MRISSCNIETFLHDFYLYYIYRLLLFSLEGLMHFYLGQIMLQNSPKEMKSFSFVVIFKLLTKEVAENLNQDFNNLLVIIRHVLK